MPISHSTNPATFSQIEAALLRLADDHPHMTVARAEAHGGAVYRISAGGPVVELAVLPGGDVVVDEATPVIGLFVSSDCLAATDLRLRLILGTPPGPALVEAATEKLRERHPDLPIVGAEVRKALRERAEGVIVQ